MLILRASPSSPFARKIRIAAAILGLSDRIEVVPADTSDPSEPLRLQNPLGKIPTLILENGMSIYDSRVILEYLDETAGGGKILPVGPARFAALTRQALADGIMDASVLQVYEKRMREPGTQSAKWVAHQAGKVARGLAACEVSADTFGDSDVGAITLACALGYLDLRFEGAWRASHPALVAWLDGFSRAIPAFEATRFQG
jgi:glutathione S-transferase